jgi:hypothetical protein
MLQMDAPIEQRSVWRDCPGQTDCVIKWVQLATVSEWAQTVTDQSASTQFSESGCQKRQF